MKRILFFGLLLAIVGSIALPSYLDMGRKALNASASANLNTVKVALEQYAKERGRLPAAAEFPKGLMVRDYLPGNQLPKAPWSLVPQGSRVSLDRCPYPLTTAARFREGSPLPPVGTDVGPVHPAGDLDYRAMAQAIDAASFDGQTPGAILYDATPDGKVAVLYGLGLRKDRCIIAAAVGLRDLWPPGGRASPVGR